MKLSRIVFSAFLLFLIHSGASAQGALLFKYYSPQQISELGAPERHLAEEVKRNPVVLRIYYISVDPNALLNSVIKFPFPDGKFTVVTKYPKVATSPTSIYWAGLTEKGEELSVSATDKEMSAAFRGANEIFVVTPLGGALHVLEVRRRLFRSDTSFCASGLLCL